MTMVVSWGDERRRMSSYAVLGIAAVVALGALALWWFVDATPAWLYWTLVGLIVLVLAFMVLLMVAKPRAAAPATAALADALAAADKPVAMGEPAPAPTMEPRLLTLRCGDCGTIFDVNDTGERPLYHTCPGCGAEGALRDPVVADAEPAAEEPQEAHAPATPPVYAVPPPPAPATVKRIKLRCGGCKEVFAIEDSGERPLRRACPHCGRMGQIQ